MTEDTNKHFKDEEKLWEYTCPEGLREHQLEHQVLINEIRDLWHEDRSEFVVGIGKRLQEWVETRLVPHFMTDDPNTLQGKSN